MNLWKWRNLGTWLNQQSQLSRKSSRRRSREFAPVAAEVLEMRALLSTLTVTTLNDTVANDNQLSLREAIMVANNAGVAVDGIVSNDVADTIVFANNLSGTVSLQGTQLQITNALTIKGSNSITIDAQGSSRIFDIVSTSGSVSLEGLTLLNGSATVSGGGAVRTASAAGLTISETTISTSVASGAGIRGGAILATAGDLTLENSTLSYNSTVGANGHGGAIAFGGAGTLSLVNTTISGNFTTAVDADGGGVYLSGGNLVSTNSTIALNDAGGTGGGVNATAASAVTINNTIIATNTDGGIAADVAALNASVSNSLIGIDAGASFTLSTDINNIIGTVSTPIDPLLAPLANNGGSVQTHALLTGSAAINAGDIGLAVDLLSLALSSDARGIGFVRASGAVDIGAFELQAGLAVAPKNIVPAALQVVQDTTLTFSAGLGTQLAISVPAAGTGTVSVSLAATLGTLSLSQITGLSFTVGDGVADANMTFTGTVADINAALEAAVFTPTASATGAGSVQITTSDLGLNGAMALTATNTVAISVVSVTGINLPPVITSPATAQVAVGSDLVFSVQAGNVISISDPESNLSSQLQVSLTATHGKLTLSQTTGLSFVLGDGTADAALIFTGSLADINAALAGLKFKANGSFNGPAVITVDVDDLASVGALTASATINVSVNTPNLTPITLPSIESVVAGTSVFLGVDLSGTWMSTNAGNASATILQAGNQLTTISAQGTVRHGVLSNDGLTITRSDGTVGTVSADGLTITWANNTWTRVSASTANDLIISNPVGGTGPVVVELTATNATITLSQLDGLVLLSGTGTADTTVRVTGTVDAVNAALKGAEFTPTISTSATGQASLSVSVNDLVSGALSVTKVLSLDVTANLAGTWYNVKGDATVIEQTGTELRISTASGNPVVGQVTSSGQFSITGYPGLNGLGKIDSSGMITFGTGKVWTRPVSPPTLATNWVDSNMASVSIATDGPALTFTTPSKVSTGFFLSDSKVIALGGAANGSNKIGTLSVNDTRIDWTDGDVWTTFSWTS